MNRKKLILSVIALFVVTVLGIRVFSGKDAWACQDGVWIKRGNPSSPMPTELCKGNMLYLDVRTDDEWNAGHIKGALHFGLEKLEAGQLPEISKDTDLRVYCKSGNRAETAKDILEKAGFTSVTNAGGFETLRSSGVQTE